MDKKNGFGKIEICIAVMIAIIFAIIVIPKLSSIIEKSKEGATKGSLGSLRSAIAMYYGDNNGVYPSTDIIKELTDDSKYIDKIPTAYTGHHRKTNDITTSDFDKNPDTGGWAYKSDDAPDSTGKIKGQIWINCTHTDSHGNVWNQL
ncbi:type II secretion system protein [Endomicrobium proavitum]|uniref:Uncharacterized protein n=1 Tax=Endomicrobium proavitum TaxID=1408281 RepID=A0A0G3WK12_9BACT|nr:hypothetical protein [Endomicrobium proavitum]AKL97844.1 hypothetical protein Epro_0465 [Endomicrobium proavitum]